MASGDNASASRAKEDGGRPIPAHGGIMMRPRTLSVIVAMAGAALATITASAQQLGCEPQSSPLLEVSYFGGQYISVQPWAILPESRAALLLCRDRRMLFWRFADNAPQLPNLAPVEPFPYQYATVSQASADSKDFSDLQVLMNDAHIGLLGNCGVALDPRYFWSKLKITWFGRGARRNTFLINAGSPATECSDSAAALATFIALGHPGSSPGGSEVTIQ
jgi:hypothetical protein